MWVTKLLISPVKKRFFAQNNQILPKFGIFGQFGPGHAGLFGALLAGRLVVVARGLYLARHLFTLYQMIPVTEKILHLCELEGKGKIIIITGNHCYGVE